MYPSLKDRSSVKMKMHTRVAIALFGSFIAASTLAGTATADESNGPIKNGSFIEVFNGDTRIGSCSATVIEKGSLLTAGHCGHVGAKVRIRDKEIGFVDSSGLRQGYDIIHVTLNPGIKVVPMKADLGYTPKTGDRVSKDGWRSLHTEGTVKDPEIKEVKSRESINAPVDGQTFTVSTWTADLVSLQGDSGGAVTHNGKVVGLVKGGPNDEVTTYSLGGCPSVFA
ncbi:trypsin-like serine protease [Corynebacterium pseudotuberculosis]|uniref:trypsin-like serine protease n=1 Tax=Corynebacterium pseudotuberculosis TaxID=1719 RepID=UPI00071C1227|nr:Trypsin [Corynebacterium pseudotuberculosis]